MRYVDEGEKKNSGRGNKKRGAQYFVIVQWGGRGGLVKVGQFFLASF